MIEVFVLPPVSLLSAFFRFEVSSREEKQMTTLFPPIINSVSLKFIMKIFLATSQQNFCIFSYKEKFLEKSSTMQLNGEILCKNS